MHSLAEVGCCGYVTQLVAREVKLNEVNKAWEQCDFNRSKPVVLAIGNAEVLAVG